MDLASWRLACSSNGYEVYIHPDAPGPHLSGQPVVAAVSSLAAQALGERPLAVAVLGMAGAGPSYTTSARTFTTLDDAVRAVRRAAYLARHGYA